MVLQICPEKHWITRYERSKACFADMLIVSKGSVEDHNKTTENVFSKLDEEKFTLKLSKCECSVNRISWLGFNIDDSGYQPKLSKVQGVLDPKPPHNLKRLRFLWEFSTIYRNFYRTFVHSPSNSDIR